MGPVRSRFSSRDSIGRNAPRFNRERCASEMIARCAALGANASNGAGEVSLSGVKQDPRLKRRMLSRLLWRLQRCKYSAVILRSRALARRLEGWPQALAAYPSRLAVKNGEHLRMTSVYVAGHRKDHAAFFGAALRP